MVEWRQAPQIPALLVPVPLSVRAHGYRMGPIGSGTTARLRLSLARGCARCWSDEIEPLFLSIILMTGRGSRGSIFARIFCLCLILTLPLDLSGANTPRQMPLCRAASDRTPRLYNRSRLPADIPEAFPSAGSRLLATSCGLLLDVNNLFVQRDQPWFRSTRRLSRGACRHDRRPPDPPRRAQPGHGIGCRHA